MRILNPPKIRDEWYINLRVICGSCEAVVQMEKGDVSNGQWTTHKKEAFLWTCPFCKTNNTVSK